MLLSAASSQTGQYGTVGEDDGLSVGEVVGCAVVGASVGFCVGMGVAAGVVILGAVSVSNIPRIW